MEFSNQDLGSISHKIFTPEPVYPQVLLNSVDSPFMNFCISNLLNNEDFTNLLKISSDRIKEDYSMHVEKIKAEKSNYSGNSKFIAYYPNFGEKIQIYKRCREISDNFISIYFTPSNNSISQSKINDSFLDGLKDSSQEIGKENLRDKIKCNCTKNNCLKQYCECLKAGKTCEGCNCRDCKNTENFQQERKTVLEKICLRRIKSTNDIEQDKTKTTFCNCKRSSCQKKYC